jgi:hypothetical protein
MSNKRYIRNQLYLYLYLTAYLFEDRDKWRITVNDIFNEALQHRSLYICKDVNREENLSLVSFK